LRLPEYVQSVVTFQSPKTMRGQVREVFDKEPSDVVADLQIASYHYRVRGDEIVEEAGEHASPGQVVELRFVDAEIGWPAEYQTHVKQLFREFGDSRGSLAAIRAVVERKLDSIELDEVGNPGGEVLSTESAAIEWLRSSSVTIVIAIPTLISRSPAPIVQYAIPLLQEVIYTVFWGWNVIWFREDPTRGPRLEFRSIGLPAGDRSSEDLLTDEQLRRMRRQFATYVEHTRIRRR
jgi:hypothetical protein